MENSKRIAVYDEGRKQMRSFEVTQSEQPFEAKCGNGLHQFKAFGLCACKMFKVVRVDEPARRIA